MQEARLDDAIHAIRVRFGSQALTRAATLPPAQPWASRTAVDRLTGIGGLPCGRITLFTGAGTCGKLTLAGSVLAAATRDFAHAIVIDGGGFDPSTLLPFYPELSALTVVRASALEITGEACATLARAGAGFILLTQEVPEHWLGPLESAASRSGTIVLCVVDSPTRALAHASSFTVGLERVEWVRERGELVGLRASARCLKNRVAPPLAETTLEIRYPLGPRRLFDHRVHVVEAPAAVSEVAECASAAV